MAKIPEFTFEFEAFKNGDDLFPPSISDDPWVAYHGTSGRNESSIERGGLQAGISPLDRKDLEAVLNVFGSMSWTGETFAYAFTRTYR